MKSKLIGLVVIGVVVVTIIVSVGGWLDNDGGGSDNTGDQGGSTPIVETGVDVMPLSEFNTDTPFENLTIEIVEYFGEHMIYKVTNDSNVCYSYLSGTTYFRSEPLPGRLPLEEGQEYYDSFGFRNIPAYSVTYHLEQAFSEEMSIDKGGSFDGTVYYPFEFGEDPYRIEIEEESNSPHSSRISDELIQDARENIVFDRNNFDASISKLGTLNNKSNHVVKYEGFVVFADGHAFSLSNDLPGEGGAYKNYLPAMNDTFEIASGYYCEVDDSLLETEEDYKKYCQAMYSEVDRNSVYANIYESDNYTAIADYDIYVNAWYVDEAIE